MLTTDLTLRFDPEFRQDLRHFHEDPQAFADALPRAWFKLTHRDMGPITPTWGRKCPGELIWQDPIPAVNHPWSMTRDVTTLKEDPGSPSPWPS